MAYVQLPDLPRRTKVRQRLVEFGNDLTPFAGGPVQRLLRFGARYALEVTLPPMSLALARTFLAARARAATSGATLRVAVPTLGGGEAVTGRTATAGAGEGLTISDGSGIEPGVFFSFVADGRSWLHMVTSVAGAALTVAPMLRADPTGQALEFSEPMIEGFADAVAWDLEALAVGHTFTLTEER